MTCVPMERRSGILGCRIGIDAVAGATIAWRIRISRHDDESARCRVSRAQAQPRDFSPLTQPPTTPSTSSAISFPRRPTAIFALRRWRRGGRPPRSRDWGHQPVLSRTSFDNVTMPFVLLALPPGGAPLNAKEPALHDRIVVSASSSQPPLKGDVATTG